MLPKKKSINPTLGKERIEVLDILRGFALFGVIVMNMSVDTLWAESFVFHTPGVVDNIIAGLLRFFGAGKFLTLFSFLFGLGLVMQIQRSTVRGVHYFPLLLRRLLVLLIIGLMHYLLIGWTDILHVYAGLGIVLLFFHRGSARTLLIFAVSIILLNVGHPKPLFIMAGEKVSSSLRTKSTASEHSNNQENRQESIETNEESEHLEQSIRIYATGSYDEILDENWNDFAGYMKDFAPRWWLGSLFPLLLLGAYVARRGILENIEEHLLFFRRVLWWGLAIGMSCSTLTLLGETLLKDHLLPFSVRQLKSLSDVVGIRALGFSYASGLILLLRNQKWRKRLTPIATVGRTAFTNYLLQTVFAVILFFSVGLGLYGQVSPILGAILAITFFAFQILLSSWWLKKFRYGPVEWLWRSFTYGQLQRMRN